MRDYLLSSLCFKEVVKKFLMDSFAGFFTNLYYTASIYLQKFHTRSIEIVSISIGILSVEAYFYEIFGISNLL